MKLLNISFCYPVQPQSNILIRTISQLVKQHMQYHFSDLHCIKMKDTKPLNIKTLKTYLYKIHPFFFAIYKRLESYHLAQSAISDLKEPAHLFIEIKGLREVTYFV